MKMSKRKTIKWNVQFFFASCQIVCMRLSVAEISQYLDDFHSAWFWMFSRAMLFFLVALGELEILIQLKSFVCAFDLKSVLMFLATLRFQFRFLVLYRTHEMGLWFRSVRYLKDAKEKTKELNQSLPTINFDPVRWSRPRGLSKIKGKLVLNKWRYVHINRI